MPVNMGRSSTVIEGGTAAAPAVVISAPPPDHQQVLHHSPSLTRSPLLIEPAAASPRLPIKSPLVTRIMTPLASPMKKAISYIEEVGSFTKFDPQDSWLPITESRNGNAYYAAFHTLSSGIGFQALFLPIAFAALGWIFGVICLSLAFIWQLYTLWLLIQLHESEDGTRYSRYLRLSMVAFGERVGKVVALFPIMYLSGGTCVTLIMVGGGTLKILIKLIISGKDPLNMVEWYMIFIFLAVMLAQLPNLNSIAGVSLIGAITAICYCTMIWIVSVCEGKPAAALTSYTPVAKSDAARLCSVLNALGMIAFSFRGHNLVLEIQGTMPTTAKQPSRLPMWKGVKFAYLVIGLCLFPLAIGGYWAYGSLKPVNGGILNAWYEYHRHDTSKVLLGLTCLLVVLNCLSSFQIYAMPVFDNLESRYTSKKNKPCPRWLRTLIRVFFGCLAFFISVALPFLPSLAGLIGGIALPVTLAYPCLMWVRIKKPPRWSKLWIINLSLGCLGILLSILLVMGAIWSIVIMGIGIHFFKPE